MPTKKNFLNLEDHVDNQISCDPKDKKKIKKGKVLVLQKNGKSIRYVRLGEYLIPITK
jgi:hypothetical protein